MQPQSLKSSELQTLFAELAASLARASTLVKAINERTGISLSIPTLVRPTHVPEDQQWFWSDHWQGLEREANEDLALGRTSGPFSSVEELHTSLNS
jgi:hypothetical protein